MESTIAMLNPFRSGSVIYADAFPVTRQPTVAEAARAAITNQSSAVAARITTLEERAARIAEELAELRILSSALSTAHETIHIAPMESAIENALEAINDQSAD